MSSRDGIVKLVSLTGYELKGWEIVIRFPEATRALLFSRRNTPAVPIQSRIQWARGALSPGIKEL